MTVMAVTIMMMADDYDGDCDGYDDVPVSILIKDD
jgi:hypothetical protein